MCVHYYTTTLLQVGFVIISSSIIPVVHVMLVPLRAIKTGRGYIFEKFLRNIKSASIQYGVLKKKIKT